MTQRPIFLYFGLIILAFTSLAFGVNTAFDLSGPPIEVKVTRGGKTLPISEVPNLQPGDRIWVHPGGDLEQAGARRRHSYYRSQGCATNSAFSGAGNRRGLRGVTRRSRGQAGSIREGIAGFESGQPGPHAAGEVSGKRPGNIGCRSQGSS